MPQPYQPMNIDDLKRLSYLKVKTTDLYILQCAWPQDVLSKYFFGCLDAPSSGSLYLPRCQSIAVRGAEKQIPATQHEAAQVLRQKMEPRGSE